jgi:hypothetical protein
MTAADERKRKITNAQRKARRPTRLQAMLAIVVAAVAIIATVAVVRHSLNEWTCKMNWSAPCADGAPLDLSAPKPGPK